MTDVVLLLNRVLPLKAMLFIRLIFGHHFSFSSRKWLLNLSKLYCVLLSVFGLLAILTLFTNSRNVICFEFSISIWMTLFLENNSFLEYSAAVKRIDRTFGVTPSRLVSSNLYTVFFLIVIIRILLCLSFVVSFESAASSFEFWALCFVYISVDFSYLIRIIIMDDIYQRLLFIRNYFSSILAEPSDDGIVCGNKVLKVNEGLLLYKQLLDSLNDLDTIKTTYLISLTMRFFTVGLLINGALKEWTEMENSISLSLYVTETLYSIALICVPPAILEMAHNEADKIESMFIFHHARYTDPDLRAAISKGISYFKLRPFRFQIWRVLPVDSSLPMSFIGLLFTLILLILQINHII